MPPFFRLIACCTALSGQCIAAESESVYPTKSIRMIVPAAPGSGPDIMARIVGQKLTESLGQTVVVDNRSGAGGVLGLEVGAKAPADGYHLIMTNAGAQTVSAGLYPKLPYDSIRDFAPISLVALAPNVLIVHPTLPAQSVKSLMALARSKPGELSFSSGGNGSTAHLSGEMFKLMARINIVHVPFKGAPAAALGVMTGQVALAFPNIPPALPLIRSGRLKALAVTTLKRSSALPEIPTVNESGLSGYEATAWFGVIAPAATPAYIVAKLNGMIQKMLQTRQLQERIASEGAEAQGNSPEQFLALIKSDIAKWTAVVKQSGARVD
jgi:tripartite-type tricarboxylate transporter receptor subunit TctC